MKKQIFATLCCMVALGAYAHPPKNETGIINIKPGQSSAKQVEALLGEPTMKQANEQLEQWLYQDKTNQSLVVLDKKTRQLIRYVHTSKELSGTWSNENACKIATGTSSNKDVVALLGMPSDLLIEGNTQQMIYRYGNNMMHLRFKDGVLLQMQTNNNGK